MDTTDTTMNRTGAVWVAGTGAFLLLAAAALFVAVRWDELPDAAKLGVVGALTGAFLLGGRALRRTLPATGDVLFHLGALLIPIDVAAVGVRLQLGWRGLLLAEGLAAGGALAALAAASGSVVLTWAAGMAPVAVAAGVAGVSPVPAPLLLALAAVAAAAVGHPVDGQDARQRNSISMLALVWATVAGLAPMLGAVAAELVRVGSQVGSGVLNELGLAGDTAGWVAIGSGLLAAGVIGSEAKRRCDHALAGLAVGVFAAGILTAGVSAELSGAAAQLALPGLFVAVEVAALASRRNRFWEPVFAGAALLAEVPAVVFGWTTAAWLFVVSPFTTTFVFFGERAETEPVFGVALGLLAVGWFLMGARQSQDSGGSLVRSVQAAVARHAFLIAPTVVAAVVEGTASGPATAAACVGMAAVLASGPRRSARLIAAALVLWAPLVTWDRPWARVAAGLAGAAVTTWAARRVAPQATSEPVGRPARGWVRRQLAATNVEAIVLTVVAVNAALIGCTLGSFEAGAVLQSMLAVGACFGIAVALEPSAVLPVIGRVGAVVAAVVVAAADAERALPALALATVLFVVEAIGRDKPMIGLGAAATVQFVVIDLAQRGGLDTAATGLALCVSAVVWAGLALVVDQRWRLPLLIAAGAAVVAGLVLAGEDPRDHAHALLIAGGLVTAGGLVSRRPAVAFGGGALLCLGFGSHLQLSEVGATDAYLAPVAALLLAAGYHLRRNADDPVSSWVAYAPAVGLLGGAALVERMAGGGGVHALTAGAVGIAAVAAGGGRRLAGPLVTGTALLMAVTVHESLGTLASVPTWGWLAAGGTLLLAVGVTLERRGASGPVEAGRRLVDVVADHFS